MFRKIKNMLNYNIFQKKIMTFQYREHNYAMDGSKVEGVMILYSITCTFLIKVSKNANF